MHTQSTMPTCSAVLNSPSTTLARRSVCLRQVRQTPTYCSHSGCSIGCGSGRRTRYRFPIFIGLDRTRLETRRQPARSSPSFKIMVGWNRSPEERSSPTAIAGGRGGSRRTKQGQENFRNFSNFRSPHPLNSEGVPQGLAASSRSKKNGGLSEVQPTLAHTVFYGRRTRSEPRPDPLDRGVPP